MMQAAQPGPALLCLSLANVVYDALKRPKKRYCSGLSRSCLVNGVIVTCREVYSYIRFLKCDLSIRKGGRKNVSQFI